MAACAAQRGIEVAAVNGEERLDILGDFADALVDPCLLLDRRGIVLHRNPAAAREFPSVVEGSLLTLGLRSPALLDAIEAARRSGGAQSVELHQTVPNETWHRAQVAPLARSEGQLAVVLQSLTERKRAEQLRSDFIANASHELRTPLTSLIGFIDTLLGPAAKDEPARERFLAIMRQQAARMSALIDDLLSLNRIELRQHLKPTGSVELRRLLREVREGLETQAQEAGVHIAIADGEPITVTGDPAELYEVFENLLDNAIKYGGDGGAVEVEIGPGRAGYDYAVTVTDHGAGVAAEHVPRLTERFYRVDAESSRRKKGTGLGLAIVKHIVNRHRGQLTIRSTPGEGTRVDVMLNR
jgi:two-component system phosphate regulon sensor histidine kinase PhoR